MPSFDVVSNVDMHELTNAVDQANREIAARFDFKGTDAHYELNKDTIVLKAQNEFQIKQMQDILDTKLTKRNIPLGNMEYKDLHKSLSEANQTVMIKQGIQSDLAKQIVKLIKNSKLKVQTAIQGEQVRVTGKKKDDLQEAIAFLKKENIPQALQYINFRD